MNKDTPDKINGLGTKLWYNSQGQLHRINGPALIRMDGHMVWYRNGKWHNEFGPAVIWADGTEWWFIDGEFYSKLEFKQYKIKSFINI